MHRASHQPDRPGGSRTLLTWQDALCDNGRVKLPFALVSDLHLEASNADLALGRARLLAACGDIYAPSARMETGDPHPAVDWLARKAPEGIPVLFVPGNHDYEGNKVSVALANMRDSARGTNVHVLWNDTFDFGGVRFLGTPLFTDFSFDGPVEDRNLDKPVSGTDMHLSFDDEGKPLSARWMIEQHRQARAFLARELDRDPHIRKVVLTHWCPTAKGMDRKFKDERNNGYWISPCEDLAEKAVLWCHGHVHRTVSTRAGRSRSRGKIVSNPRGWSKIFNLATNDKFVQPKLFEV